MTDPTANPGATTARSPGALLRAARESRGMHLAALAAAIKVAPARLEALEADDFSGMPDTTFARALAQAVCRALKIDPAPVMALMPASTVTRLERVDEGLNRPFSERRGGIVPDVMQVAPWRHPVAWLALLLLAAAAAFVFWPRLGASIDGDGAAAPSEPASGSMLALPEIAVPGAAKPSAAARPTIAAPEAVSAASTPLRPAASAPAAAASSLPILASGAAMGASPALSAMPANPSEGAVLKATQDTWVQVTDATGKVLLGRTVAAGETLPFNGPWPMRFRIGNAKGTSLTYRGQLLDLPGMTKDNTVSLALPLGAASPAAAPTPAPAATPTPPAAPAPAARASS